MFDDQFLLLIKQTKSDIIRTKLISDINVDNSLSKNNLNLEYRVTDDKTRIMYSKHTEEKHTFVYKKLVVPTTKRSIYWKCFGFPANEEGEILTKVKIICLLCKAVITYNGNTSNLRMHLQSKHMQELNELEASSPPKKPRVEPKPKPGKKKISNMYTTDIDGALQVDANMHIISDPSAVLEEADSASNLRVVLKDSGDSDNIAFLMSSEDDNHFGHNQSGDRSKISDAIAEMAVLDLHLPDVVQSVGFQRLVATLRSPCEIPSKANLIDDILPRMYDSCRDQLKEALALCTSCHFAVSFEEWQAACGDAYITMSLHFQQQGNEEQLHTKVLTTMHCSPLFNADHWSNMIDRELKEWGISEDSISAMIVATNHEPLIAALKTTKITLIPCLLYTLQDICSTCSFNTPEVSVILTKIRTILAIIFRSSTAQATLRIQENLLQLEDGVLSTDYPRAWMSTYVMLEQLAVRRTILPNVIENLDSVTSDVTTLTDDEWAIVEDIITVLEPFKVTAMTLAEEKAPLISLLKPLMSQLMSIHLKVRELDSDFAQELKKNLSDMLKDRYVEVGVDEMLKSATTLDPRFKQLPYAGEDSKATLSTTIKEALTKSMADRGILSSSDQSNNESEDNKRKARLSGMKMLFGGVTSSGSGQLSVDARADLELALYQGEPNANLDQCPLVWWQKSASKFANLARLAAVYNCVPATATPPSRIPVDAQVRFDLKRAKLSADIIDKIIFLHSNYNC
ncbi:E3 SUMO-protein ligase ZBED1 isoform X2 [Nilaparvata lugens]|uniref:E3 SUMO-protein ligase ZBED1 isoform X2 n=1 Tax=Nilaparvata lugens TaxID=108931 RepID=UPI00193E4A1D|nr:E3 SUMO-protein ligase ZBED1 isoform X2 [Nilaparvata lugens]